MFQWLPVKSLVELIRARDELLAKPRLAGDRGVVSITVGMGNCGVAAGSTRILKTILEDAVSSDLNHIVVFQGVCIGLCEQEPILQVELWEGARTIYGRVNPEAARRILREHILGGKVVWEYLIREEPVSLTQMGRKTWMG